MNNKWKWVLGLILAMMVLIVPPFAWGFFVSYGMTRNTNEWYMPMMYGSPVMMSIGMIFLIWLILLALLVLIGLGMAWLVKELTAPRSY